METIWGNTIKMAFVGVGLYVIWYILPPIKQNLVGKLENKLGKRGFLKHYLILHRVVKTFLYVVLALMILLPVLFFLMIFLDQSK